MRASWSWSWSWLLVLAACSEHGSPPDAQNLPDCICPKAELASDRTMMDFGGVAVSSSSPVSAVQISNGGTGESGVITAVATGSSAAEFTITNGCTTLAGGGTCVMTVGFSPTTTGAKTATLNISSSPGGTITIALTGTGT
jgi:hypothetical protein